MNKLKILNTVALLVLVATPISQASLLNDIEDSISVFNDIKDSMNGLYDTCMIVVSQRDETLEQLNEAREQLKERTDYAERLEILLKEKNDLINQYIFNRGYNKWKQYEIWLISHLL